MGIVLAATALLVLLAQVPSAPADCCGYEYQFIAPGGGGWSPQYIYRCADCTEVRQSYCGVAGGGGCNVFGCNCGGGCIQPIPGRECSLTCCDKRSDRHDRRTRREVTSGAISAQTGNFTGRDVIIAADLDESGHLDEIEVHVYLTQRGLPVDDFPAWRTLDSNADGKLTAAEIDTDLRH